MRTRTRLRSAKKGHGAQRNILQRRLWFSFSDSGAIVDLGADNPLVIRANVDVREAAGADQIVSLYVWETNRRGISTKRKPPASFVVFRLDIQVDRNGMRVVSISQDPSTFKGKERQRRSKDGWLWEKRLSNGGKDMYLPARVTITDSGGAPLSGGEDLPFVLPPLEYDDLLQLQLECTAGRTWGPIGLVGWRWLDSMEDGEILPIMRNGTLTDEYARAKRPLPNQSNSRLKGVVVHSMSGVAQLNVRKGWITDTDVIFDVNCNVQIFVDIFREKRERVGAHFIIDRDGAIHQLCDVRKYIGHAGYGSRNTVGIELLGFPDNFRDTYCVRYQDKVKSLSKLGKIKADEEADLKNYDAGHVKQLYDRRGGVRGGRVKRKVTRGYVVKDIDRLAQEIERTRKWIRGYEQFTADKVSFNGREVPAVFLYTDAQYEALGRLLFCLGKRYRYREVVSHHWYSFWKDANRPKEKKKLKDLGLLGDSKKTIPTKMDPGIYFDWSRIDPYLEEGSDDGGCEADSGRQYLCGQRRP